MRKRLFYNITIDVYLFIHLVLLTTPTKLILLVSRWTTEFLLWENSELCEKKKRELYTALSLAKKLIKWISEVFANKFNYVAIICYL